jgi:hypothetical protein
LSYKDCSWSKYKTNTTTNNQKIYVVALRVDEHFDELWYMSTLGLPNIRHMVVIHLWHEKWEHGQVVYLGDNTIHQIYGQGNVSIKLNSCQIKDIFNVLHVLAFRNDYFFTKQFDQVGGKIIIIIKQCILKKIIKGIVIAICNLKSNIYKLGITHIPL